MNKIRLYRALRIDHNHINQMQIDAEYGDQLAGLTAFMRTTAPPLPGGQGGVLAGCRMTYFAGPQEVTIQGSFGPARSICVDQDGTLIELLTDSLPLDVSVYAPPANLPFVVWAWRNVVPSSLTNVIIYDPALGEQIQAVLFRDVDDLAFAVTAPGAPPPAAGAFVVSECTSWSAGLPVWRRCGPLRDLTAHVEADDDLKAQSIADALYQAAQAFDVGHYLPGNGANTGRHVSPLYLEGGGADPSILFHGPANSFLICQTNELMRITSLIGGAGITVSSPGIEGGLAILGPSGPGNDLAPGESAHLRFGRDNAAPWTSSRDWAIRSNGAVLDSDRQLWFEIGSPPSPAVVFNQSRMQFAGDMVVTGLYHYKYGMTKEFCRTIASQAWRIQNDGSASSSPQAGLCSAVGAGTWAFVDGSLAIWVHPCGGVGENTANSGDFSAGTWSVNRVVHSLEWVPQSTILRAGDLCEMLAEADPAPGGFLGAANQRIEIAVIAHHKATGALLVPAYARFLPLGAAPASVTGAWTKGPDWVACGGDVTDLTFDHLLYHYSLIAQIYNGGAIGATVGCSAFFGLTLAFRTSIFRH